MSVSIGATWKTLSPQLVTVRFDSAVEWLEASGVRLPQFFVVSQVDVRTDAGRPLRWVELTVRVERGAPTISQVSSYEWRLGVDVDVAYLAGLRLETLLEAATSQLAGWHSGLVDAGEVRPPDGQPFVELPVPWPPDLGSHAVTVVREARKARFRSRYPVDRVVRMYRKRVESGSGSPTQDVADALGVSRASIGRVLKSARDQGLLPPGEQGRSRA